MKGINKSQGFTLIELMIVVAIIGILAAVALPAYRDYVGTSHGGSAMKGVSGFTQKAITCTQTGIGCTELAGEITAVAKLSGTITQDVGGTLTWDDGDCSVAAAIDPAAAVVYTAATTGSGATLAQCQEGAGLTPATTTP